MAVIDGVPSEITTEAVFNVEASVINEGEYSFTGTVQLLGETYAIAGREILPSGVSLEPQATAYISDIRAEARAENEEVVYTLCGDYFYGWGGWFSSDFSDDRGAELVVIEGAANENCYGATYPYPSNESDFAVAGVINMSRR